MKRFFIRFMGVLVALVGARGAYAATVTAKAFATSAGTVYAHAFVVSGDGLSAPSDVSGKSWGVCTPTGAGLLDSRNPITRVYNELNCAETAVGQKMSDDKGGWYVPFYSGLGAGTGWNGISNHVRCMDTNADFVYSVETGSAGNQVIKANKVRCCCVDGGVVCAYGYGDAADSGTTVYMNELACTITTRTAGSGYGEWRDGSTVSRETRYYIPASKVNHNAEDASEAGCEEGFYATTDINNVMYSRTKWEAGTGSDGLCSPCPKPVRVAGTTGIGTDKFDMNLSGHVLVSNRFGDNYEYCDPAYSYCDRNVGLQSCRVVASYAHRNIIESGVSNFKLISGSDGAGKYFMLAGTGCHATE